MFDCQCFHKYYLHGSIDTSKNPLPCDCTYFVMFSFADFRFIYLYNGGLDHQFKNFDGKSKFDRSSNEMQNIFTKTMKKTEITVIISKRSSRSIIRFTFIAGAHTFNIITKITIVSYLTAKKIFNRRLYLH